MRIFDFPTTLTPAGGPKRKEAPPPPQADTDDGDSEEEGRGKAIQKGQKGRTPVGFTRDALLGLSTGQPQQGGGSKQKRRKKRAKTAQQAADL